MNGSADPLPLRIWNWLQRHPACWALFALLAGFWRCYLPYFGQLDSFIIGDLTDGYFNLWILEHTRSFLVSGDLHDYIHTRLFVPNNHLVLFWSDNLFFPGILYSLFKAVVGSPIVAFNLTALSLIVAGFWIFWDFLTVLYRQATGSTGPVPLGAGLLATLLAYVYAFGDTRLLLTTHFQNQTIHLVFLGVSCAVRYLQRDRVTWLAATMSVWVLLCYSVPYYALALSLLLAAFAALYLRAFGWANLGRKLRTQGWVVALGLALVLPIAAGYLAVRSPYSSQAEHSAYLWHIFMPDGPTKLAAWLQGLGHTIPYRTHESLAYAGFFFAPVLLGIFLLAAWRAMPGQSAAGKLVGVGGSAALLAGVWHVAHGGSPGAFALVAAACGGVAALLVYRSTPERLTPLWLLLAMIICYGTALGPVATAPLRPANPSLWGVLAKITPAYDSIRTVGRFGTLGFGFALGLAWYLANRRPADGTRVLARRLTLGTLAGAALVTALMDPPRPPYCHRYDFSALTPTLTERKFYATNPGRLLVMPVNNLSLIPGHMIYFEQLPGIELVSGYSGRFSPLVESLNVADDKLSPELITQAMTGSRATHLLLDKRAYSTETMTQLAATYGATLQFENPAYWLLKRTHASGP